MLASTQARVEHILQLVAQQVGARHDELGGEGGKGAGMPEVQVGPVEAASMRGAEGVDVERWS
ncbi:MAG: hypothetical protein OXF62_14330 [Caldilineaceae bacterium]|nr:hypothetical protein [Caldilineaceae bacterium]